MPPTCCESKRWRALLVGSGLLAVMWLVVLPRLSATAELRRQIDFLEQRGIDPSAMFYTELDAMEGVHNQVRRTERSHREAFWLPWHRRSGSRNKPPNPISDQEPSCLSFRVVKP